MQNVGRPPTASSVGGLPTFWSAERGRHAQGMSRSRVTFGWRSLRALSRMRARAYQAARNAGRAPDSTGLVSGHFGACGYLWQRLGAVRQVEWKVTLKILDCQIWW